MSSHPAAEHPSPVTPQTYWFAQGTLIHGPDNGGIDIGALIGEARTEASAASIVRTHNAMVRAASTPVTAMRHHPNDNCGDPEHDAILEAWYARAEALLDRRPVPALDVERLARAMDNTWIETVHRDPTGRLSDLRVLASDTIAQYRRLSGDEGADHE